MRFTRRLCLLFVFVGPFGLFLLGAPARGAPLLAAVDGVAVTVADADRSLAFYRDVLGAVPLGEDEAVGPEPERLYGLFGSRVRRVRLRIGSERLELMEFLAPRGRPIPPDQRSHDGGFQHVAIVVSDMDAAYRWLRAHRVRHVSSGPQTLPAWNHAAAGIRAFYFADPDGHTLEIIWFPPGKGEARWPRHQEGDGPAALFVGIDHTAIGVADSDASLRLYRDRLGMRVAGTSENHGTEQEHLNNVFGARLRITTLRAAEGPGIELLQYLAPRDGRPAPADLRPNDLLHWQTVLQVGDVEAALAAVVAAGAQRVSSDGNARAGTGTEAALVRDADAHGLLLIARRRIEAVR